MTGGKLKFDMARVLQRARRTIANHLGDVTLTFPFGSIAVKPTAKEKIVARKTLILLQNRRVLSARECCDDCVDRSLNSLQEIRAILVEKQTELANLQDGPLYTVLALMAKGIRQFLTYEEDLRRSYVGPPYSDRPDFHRPPHLRKAYFDALERLRDHLSHCIGQMSAIAKVPAKGQVNEYQRDWRQELYKDPAV
jgi:hypothetical protein